VHGFRKDVRIVNLSLLNTPWYGEQLRDEEPKVPMSYTVDELYSLRPVQERSTGELFLVKDQVAMDIINTVFENNEPRPIYFAVTVDDLMDLERVLRLEGLVFRLELERAREALASGDSTQMGLANDVNLEVTRKNLTEVYRYRGLLLPDGSLDPNVFRDSNEEKLVTNYAAAWARMALAYRDEGNFPESIQCMKNAIKITPNYDPIVGSLGSILLEGGQYEEAKAFYLNRLETRPQDERVYIGLAYLAGLEGNNEEALDWYLKGLRVAPTSLEMLAGLYQGYTRLGRYPEAENVLRQWVALHPGDTTAATVLQDLHRRMKESAGEGAGDSS
jgi:tetratricopeptide (TPR) repeat protein